MIRRTLHWGRKHWRTTLCLGVTAGLVGAWASGGNAAPRGHCSPCTVDGVCLPNPTWGFYQTSWRRWPTLPTEEDATKPGAQTPGGGKVPVVDPPPKEKEDLDMPSKPPTGKPGEKAEAKPEVKPDTKPIEPPLDLDLTPKAKAKDEPLPKPDVEPEIKPKAKDDVLDPDSLLDPKVDPKVDPKTAPKIDADEAPKFDPLTDPTSDPKVDAKPPEKMPLDTDPLDLQPAPKGKVDAPKLPDAKDSPFTPSPSPDGLFDGEPKSNKSGGVRVRTLDDVQAAALFETAPRRATREATANVEGEVSDGPSLNGPRAEPAATPTSSSTEPNPLRGWSSRKSSSPRETNSASESSWNQRRNPLR